MNRHRNKEERSKMSSQKTFKNPTILQCYQEAYFNVTTE